MNLFERNWPGVADTQSPGKRLGKKKATKEDHHKCLKTTICEFARHESMLVQLRITGPEVHHIALSSKTRYFTITIL